MCAYGLTRLEPGRAVRRPGGAPGGRSSEGLRLTAGSSHRGDLSGGLPHPRARDDPPRVRQPFDPSGWSGGVKQMKKGLVIVNTGNGKGKTTAALGLLLRAWGRDLRVCVIQFIKAETGGWGEIKAAKKLGIDWFTTGDGFTWTSKDMNETVGHALHGWEIAKEKIAS